MLIYDGDCGFCTVTAHWFEDRLERAVPVRAWQTLDLDDVGLTEDDVTTAAYWIDDDGSAHRGHLAIGRALETAGGPYRRLGWLMRRPPISGLARPAYWLVARYRHRLPGSTDACRIS